MSVTLEQEKAKTITKSAVEAVTVVPVPVVPAVEDKRDLLGAIPFILIHLACFTAFFTGVSMVAVIVCLAGVYVRLFALTGGFHRYFAHRSYKTSRVFQFVMAYIGTSAAQMGPLWWAGHHRDHHRYSDTEKDLHSPITQGFFESHIGWILRKKNYPKDIEKKIPDFAKFGELRFLNRFPLIPPVILAFGMFFLGVLLENYYPGLHTNGWQMLVWGFVISTVLLYHITFSINSFTHILGWQRFKTGDQSRNFLPLALLTWGEGWHNNHHHYPHSEPQGFFWWEIDITHYVLNVLSWFGIVWDIRKAPKEILTNSNENAA